MSLEEVKEIQHVRDPRMVNEMIKVGWVLISTNSGTMEDGSAWPLYIMGWKHNRVAARVKQDW